MGAFRGSVDLGCAIFDTTVFGDFLPRERVSRLAKTSGLDIAQHPRDGIHASRTQHRRVSLDICVDSTDSQHRFYGIFLLVLPPNARARPLHRPTGPSHITGSTRLPRARQIQQVNAPNLV